MLIREHESGASRVHNRFKFENAWLIDPKFHNCVCNKWHSYGENDISVKLSMCVADLSLWNRNNFLYLKHDTDNCRRKLDCVLSQVHAGYINYFNALRKCMSHLLAKEDTFLRQRAKTHWFWEGDLNTRRFHAATTSRRKINRLTSLVNTRGTRFNDTLVLCNVPRDYFAEIFHKQNNILYPVLDAINPSISEDANTNLTTMFTIDEFRDAMFSMKLDKCSGPDRFSPDFYQYFWPLIGQENFQESYSWLTADIENNLSRVLKLIKSEDQRKKEDKLRKETELVGLIEDFYNQYQSLYVLYGRLTREYTKAPPRRVKRASSLNSTSSDDTEYFSSDDTEFYHSDLKSRISQRGRYSSFVNTLEALKTQKSTETNEFEAHEVKQLREKNAELEKAVSVLNEKIKNNEEQAMSKTSDLMARINKLEQEAKSLRNNKGKIEEKMKRFRNEALSQKKEFTDQINAMQQNFESVRNNNTKLEARLENEREKVSQYLLQIKKLEENSAETVTAKQSLLKEKKCFIERIKDLESRCSKENNLEEQLRNAMCEINTLQKQKIELDVRNNNTKLEARLENEREKVLQYLIQINFLEENLAETVTAKQSLLKEKKCFIERIKDLESRCSKENNLEEQLRNAICEINTLQKQKIELELQNERNQKEFSKLNKQLTERKMDELAEGYRQKMEDNIHILHGRIHTAEQLNNENKDSYKLTKQKYEEENKMLGAKIADYEDEIRMLKAKVWKSEADVSKEGGEKMNLMKTVTQFERKMGKLEKKLKEKDDELVSLGETKKEAIRQLCFLVDFHRDRCFYLKDLILKMRVKNKK